MIQWTNTIHRFDGPGGPVAVNGDAGRWCLDRLDPNALHAAVEDVLALPGRAPTEAWVRLCRNVPQSGEPAEIKGWVDAWLSTPTDAAKAAVSRPVRLLAALRLRGVLLWPTAACLLPHPYDPGKRLLVPDGKTVYERVLLAALPPNSGASSLLMSCSPVGSADEVCEAALLRALNVVAASKHWKAWRRGGTGVGLFRALEGNPRSDGSMVTILEPAQDMLHRNDFIGYIVPRYGAASARMDATPWLEWFGRASARSRRKSGYEQDHAWTLWLSYLASLGSIPVPSAVTRADHVLGSGGFLAWLRAWSDPSGSNCRKHLARLHELLVFMAAEGGMAVVPVHPGDIPPKRPINNKSNKVVLPRELMVMGREVVREILGAALQQYDALSDQRWTPAGVPLPNSPEARVLASERCLPETLLTGGRFSCLLATFRGADGTLVRLINPVLPTALLWLLRMPNRGIEVRFLDSGEADELVPDMREERDARGERRAVVDWRPNIHPLATPGRCQGAVCRVPDPKSGRYVLGFYINTNKSQAGGHADGADRGRAIPWEDPEMLLAFDHLGLWQRRLNPVDRLLARNDLRGKSLRPSDGLLGRLPAYCYLFRHLEDGNLGGRLEPPTHPQLSSFLRIVLDEVEARLHAEAEATDAGRGPADRIVVARQRRSDRPLHRTYSLHCLRVTGITALTEAGVPFWIISEIVAGHQSWIMTLHYNKVSPGMIVDALAAAWSRAADGTLEDEAAEAAGMTSDELERRFVSDGKVAMAMQGAQIEGFWLPMIDGLCSNGATLCHEGGPPVDGSGRHGPVEGGARNCGLCRFFLTGERFIAGQVVMINSLLHQARRQARGLQELWVQRRGEPDSGRRKRLDDRIGRVEATIDLTLRTVNARVRLLWKSRALAEATRADKASSSDGDLLITRLGETDVEASLRAVSELGFLDEVSRVAALVPELDIQDAPIERNAMIDRLLDENGFEGLLCHLPPAAARVAGDAFTDALRALSPSGVTPGTFIDEVSERRAPLLDRDTEVIAAEISHALGMRIELRRRDGPVIEGPANGSLPGPTKAPK